jgi:hypothetical protein
MPIEVAVLAYFCYLSPRFMKETLTVPYRIFKLIFIDKDYSGSFDVYYSDGDELSESEYIRDL